MADRPGLLSAGLLLLLGLVGSACAPAEIDSTPSPGPVSVTLRLSGRELVINGGSCTWYEGSGQLLVEAGDANGVEYVLIAAPLLWLGEALPEGPGEPAELSVRLGGNDLRVDQHSLNGSMVADQTRGTFIAEFEGGSPVTGEWLCGEVVDQ